MILKSTIKTYNATNDDKIDYIKIYEKQLMLMQENKLIHIEIVIYFFRRLSFFNNRIMYLFDRIIYLITVTCNYHVM